MSDIEEKAVTRISENMLKKLIKQKSAQSGLSMNLLYRRFFMEKILERIASSEYNKHFILKGGVLVSSLTRVEARATQDIDVTLKNTPLTPEAIQTLFDEIGQVDLEDGVVFKYDKMTTQKSGCRVFFGCWYGKTQRPGSSGCCGRE